MLNVSVGSDFAFVFVESYAEEASDADQSAESDANAKDLFIPYRGYCARKAVRTYSIYKLLYLHLFDHPVIS